MKAQRPLYPAQKLSTPAVLTQLLSACTSMAHLHQLQSRLVRLGLQLDNDAVG